MQKKDFANAIMELEHTLGLCPEQLITLKTISFLYALNPKDKKKAIKNLKSLLAIDPNDIEGILKLASLIEQSYFEEAINLYEKAFSILTESNIPIPIELLNNLAILIMNDDPNRSLILLQKAKNMVPSEDIMTFGISINYSIGRALETLGKYTEAIEIYKTLISIPSPKQILSHVRLGFVTMALGDSSSSDHFKDAIGLDESCKEAWAGIAMIHLKSKAITLARKTFERILSKIDKHDLFSLLSLGNIHLVICKHELRTGQGSWEASLGRAIEFFQKCLMLDGNNYYAVNGMAIAVALKGPSFISSSRDAFLVIRQEEPNFIDAWINLAHTYMEEQHFAAAQGIYEHCWKRLTAEKREILSAGRPIGEKEKIISELALHIAKSFYLTGKTVKDRVAFSKSIEWMATITPLSEEEKMTLNFNEAITRQEFSACILQSEISSRSFENVKSALENLDKAVLMFEQLCINVNDDKATNFPVDIKLTRQRIKYCHSLKSTAKKQYEEQLETEKAKKKSQEEYTRIMAEAEEKRQEEERLIKEAYEEEQKQIEELRRATRERLAEAQVKWKNETQENVDNSKKKRNSKRARRSPVVKEDTDDEDEDQRPEALIEDEPQIVMSVDQETSSNQSFDTGQETNQKFSSMTSNTNQENQDNDTISDVSTDNEHLSGENENGKSFNFPDSTIIMNDN